MNNDKCIYLIHGFASAPKYPSDKAEVLERVFKLPVKQLSYDSAANCQANIQTLQSQVDGSPLLFVGASLGAFYASRLSELYYEQYASLPVMLNPCHNPYSLLRSFIGDNINFTTGEYFTLTDSVVVSYKNIPFVNESMIIPRWILLNMDDELIDPEETKSLYGKTLEVIPFEYGGHRFENIGSKEVIAAMEGINNSYFIHSVAND